MHGVTGADLAGHTIHAGGLGQAPALQLELFRRSICYNFNSSLRPSLFGYKHFLSGKYKNGSYDREITLGFSTPYESARQHSTPRYNAAPASSDSRKAASKPRALASSCVGQK